MAFQAPGSPGQPTVNAGAVVITSPTSSSTYDAGTSASLNISGTAASNRSVSACTWSNNLGGSGSTTGTTTWSITGVALTVGSNVITITCTNSDGVTANDVITVTRSSGSTNCTPNVALTQAAIQTALTSASAGSTVCLPVGTLAVGSTIDASAAAIAANVTLMGQTSCTGAGQTLSCTDSTVLTLTGSGKLLNITLPTTGIFRMSGLTFQGLSCTADHSMSFQPFNSANYVSARFDHNHWLNFCNFNFEGSNLHGVADHNYFDNPTGPPGANQVRPFGVDTDTEWTHATNFGTDTFNWFYFEDSRWERGIANDCYSSARMVFRYNYMNASGIQEHGTGHSGQNRGCRGIEAYYNTMIGSDNENRTTAVAIYTGSGIIFGNAVTYTCSQCGNSVMLDLVETRQSNYTYPFDNQPNKWGFCGNFWSGTVNTNGTAVTWVSGGTSPNGNPINFFFDSGLSPTKTVQAAAGSRITINGVNYTLASNAAATSLTLTSSAGVQSNVPFVFKSDWDSNTDSTGYPCLDQVGRGAGDLLASDFPTKVNSTLGSIIAWPRQALEPVYEWLNTGTVGSSWVSVFRSPASSANIVANRDYYVGHGNTNCNAGAGSCTAGVGNGVLASIPANCTAGVAYWATDTNGLYKCASANTWTWYYSPFTYPHPNVGTLPVNNYSTTFPSVENPMAEQNSVWTQGGSTGVNWTNVRTTANQAFGTINGFNGFDDSIAVLKGTWNATQGAQATVRVVTSHNNIQEVELLLRFSISANNAHGYEINCSVNPSDPYMQIIKWNGALGNFTPLDSRAVGCANGDTLSATISGTTIKAYKNGVFVFSVTDSTWASGAPGVGFYLQNVSGINADYGLSKFSAYGQ